MSQSAQPFYHAQEPGDALFGKTGAVSVSIFADRPVLRDTLRQAAENAGLFVRQAESLDGLEGDTLVLGDIIMLDVPLPDAEVLAWLSRLDMRAGRVAAQLVISTTSEGLDAVFGCIDQSQAQILVSPRDADRVVALGSALARLPGGSLQELTGEDRVALIRLTEQVSMLARRIEGLTDEDDGTDDAGRLRSPGYTFGAGARPAERQTPAEGAPPLPNPVLLREIIRQRELRAKFFESDLFADPAWDILLDLAAARAEGKQVSVSSLCIAAGVPPTTALRWIGQMTEAGLLQRISDRSDRRRAFIALTDKAANAMASYFARLDAGSGMVI